MCSTPVGIKDRFTGRGQSRRPCWQGAQRLSASKIGSRVLSVPTNAVGWCSTPVGIKDRFTMDELQGHGTFPVLNACRHQRSVHHGRQGCPEAGHCVLNACRHQRSVHPLLSVAVGPTPCAQRLSASKIGSRKDAGCHDLFKSVLNACRHQRSVHRDDQARQRAERRAVLNACRHQRSVHASSYGVLCWVPVCSTPVGIKDRFTLLRPGVMAMAVKCSTPVGIKDRFTGGGRRRPKRV